MRSLSLLALALFAAATSAQSNRLPTFDEYAVSPVYQGLVAPLDESSSPTARTYRTITREAMARGVNFAGHYVVAQWGCGTECVGGHIVDARTGRVVARLPFFSPFVTFRPDSQLITVATPDDLAELFPPDDAGHRPVIPPRYESSYWVLDGDSLRHVGSLLPFDIAVFLQGSSMYELRQAEPGNVLVPLAVGNTWRYSGSGSSVVYRITGPNPEGEGVLVERVHRGRGRETRTVETWSASTAVGDGSFYARTATGRSSGFGYTFGTANTEGEGVRLEYEPFAIGDENRYGVCYVVEQTDINASFVRPGRTCFLSGIGIVSDDRDGWMTLTSYTLR